MAITILFSGCKEKTNELKIKSNKDVITYYNEDDGTDFSSIIKKFHENAIFELPLDSEIYLDFGDLKPKEVEVKDYWLSEDGSVLRKTIFPVDVEKIKDIYSFKVTSHMEYMFYLTPSNKVIHGFTITVGFDNDKEKTYRIIIKSNAGYKK